MRVPVQLDIPAEYVDSFLDGSLVITKAIVRTAKDGQIQKHIDLLPAVKDDAIQILNNKKVRIAFGITAAALLVGGLITIVVKKHNEASDVEIPDNVIRFQKLFRTYLQEAKSGNLDLNTINELLDALDEIEVTQTGAVTIDFSIEELTTLLSQIYEYTKELAMVTSVSVSDISAPIRNSGGNILNLKQYLRLQKQIIEGVA